MADHFAAIAIAELLNVPPVGCNPFKGSSSVTNTTHSYFITPPARLHHGRAKVVLQLLLASIGHFQFDKLGAIKEVIEQ